jgi:hypothetical protein
MNDEKRKSGDVAQFWIGAHYQGYSGLWRCDWKAADMVHHAKPQGLSPVWAVLRTIIFVTCENVGCNEGLPRLWRC